jgi:hypothetical protein
LRKVAYCLNSLLWNWCGFRMPIGRPSSWATILTGSARSESFVMRTATSNFLVIIITAKHSDGPIDPQRLRLANLDWIPSVVKKIDPGLLLNVEQDGSIAMVWLKNHEHTEDVAAALRRWQLEEGSRCSPALH